jgi:recombination endonuclease VII
MESRNRIGEYQPDKYDYTRNRISRIKYQYGLTPEGYGDMLRSQESRCAICQRNVKLDIDHDHVNDRVRGLLCGKCNKGLGLFKDSEHLLSAAIAYLRMK